MNENGASKLSFLGVDGVFMPVSDLTRSVRWYTEVLGLEIRHRDEPHAAVLKIGQGLPALCLVQSGGPLPAPFPPNRYDVTHFFNFKAADIDAVHSELAARGVDVSPIYQSDALRYFGFQDPDGNGLGVVN
ncbi:VOC family protein [Gordoniibacillus kamchatkensis]|uniref:VOC family protein n=1 Tax=Gordoniibacillus kamchatkensis TaxID=1590651 RepID=UPI0012E058BE|nr:VOC family protein [Paenibacillus sp. VKM B-2647]